MADDGDGRRWHLDRRVSIGHLLTTTAVAVSVVLWLADVEKRVSLNVQALALADRRIERIEARHSVALVELKSEIRDGFAAMRTDLRALAGRVDRQRDQAATQP
jgi:hypothetical protein